MLEISLKQAQGRVPVTVMHLKGTFDTPGAEIFDASAAQVIAGGAKNVLVDLGKVDFMSSVGIRAIHRLFYQLHPEGTEEYQRIMNEGVRQGIYKAPHMKLLSPTARVLEILKMVGVDLYMEILTGDVDKAVKSF